MNVTFIITKRLAAPLTAGLLLLALILSVASCRSQSATSPNLDGDDTTPSGLNLSLARNLLLAEVNESRRAAGLNEVELDATASQAAQSHSDDMAKNEYLSHLNTDGYNPVERYNIAGGWEPAYENAWRRQGGNELDQATINQMHTEWMESPGHKSNVLLPTHTHVGIGFSYDKSTDKMYGVELFISRKAYSVSVSDRNVAAGDQVEYFAAMDPDELMFSEILIARADSVGPQTPEWLDANPHYTLPDDYIGFYVETDAVNVIYPGALKRAILDYDREAGIVQGNVHIEQVWEPGVYYLYTWGKYQDSLDNVLLSILTVEVTD